MKDNFNAIVSLVLSLSLSLPLSFAPLSNMRRDFRALIKIDKQRLTKFNIHLLFSRETERSKVAARARMHNSRGEGGEGHEQETNIRFGQQLFRIFQFDLLSLFAFEKLLLFLQIRAGQRSRFMKHSSLLLSPSLSLSLSRFLLLKIFFLFLTPIFVIENLSLPLSLPLSSLI